jgi:hypothetical protein
MNTYIETKLFSVTSNSATTKNNGIFLSDVVFESNNFIQSEGVLNLDVALIHAEIPVSFYVINEYNNQFRFKIDTDPITTVSIPYGNYNSASLITQLLTAINKTNFTITISKLTGKLTFSHNTTYIIYNNFSFSIGTTLGFSPNTINTSVGPNPFLLTAPYMLNLLGAKKLNIVSNELSTINHSSEVGSLSMLSSIAVDQPAYGLVIYENKSGIKHNLRVKDINRVDIQILDENHNLINFNNIDWSMLLCFYITRQNNSLQSSFSDLIKGTIEPQPKVPLENTKEKEIPKPPELQDLEFLTS